MSAASEQMAIPPVWRSLVNDINGGRIPDGEPGIRDVDAPCEAFEPYGKPWEITKTFGDCQTDGHYICAECIHIELATLRSRRDQCIDCGATLLYPQTGATCPDGCFPLVSP